MSNIDNEQGVFSDAQALDTLIRTIVQQEVSKAIRAHNIETNQTGTVKSYDIVTKIALVNFPQDPDTDVPVKNTNGFTLVEAGGDQIIVGKQRGELTNAYIKGLSNIT